jgi:hypothetical protein
LKPTEDISLVNIDAATTPSSVEIDVDAVDGSAMPPPPPPQNLVPFVTSETFDGARLGYQFQCGTQGNGYYILGSGGTIPKDNNADDDESDDDDVGPSLPVNKTSSTTIKFDGSGTKQMSGHGLNMMPGEGAAIASYVQRNMRIPRRGEVGWTGNEIANLESQGYVMSGSRHAKMNAVRLRKENQVYTNEEKRALVLMQAQQQAERTEQISEEFKIMVDEELARKKAEARARAVAAAAAVGK